MSKTKRPAPSHVLSASDRARSRSQNHARTFFFLSMSAFKRVRSFVRAQQNARSLFFKFYLKRLTMLRYLAHRGTKQLAAAAAERQKATTRIRNNVIIFEPLTRARLASSSRTTTTTTKTTNVIALFSYAHVSTLLFNAGRKSRSH
jgi:hypothetical protein